MKDWDDQPEDRSILLEAGIIGGLMALGLIAAIASL